MHTQTSAIERTQLNQFLPNLLAQQVDARPGATAVIDERGRLSYRELEHAAGRMAALLRDIGVGADECVGLHVEPSRDLTAGVWGILLAGAAYLPLSPEYPPDRLRYMVEDSGARVVITQDHLVDRLESLVPAGTRILTLAESDAISPVAGVASTPDSLAYVIYTSGSTGQPKGVAIEHRSIVSQLRWLHAFGHLGGGATVLQKTPMSFDAAQWEILAPAFGGCVVMGAPGVYRDPEALISTIIEHEVTTLQCVPTLLQALLDTEELRTCTSLRRVFSGGEALPRELARQITDEIPWASLINLYGPTECTINATAHLVDPGALGDGGGTIPIGVPVDNTQCFILDENMSPADIGEVGELHIGGAQLARGYLNRPEQTRERFIASPFVPTERLYRTGDLAHWNPDGSIQFAGRIDNQVKLRGYRVELDEIALAISEHTWVKRAAVVVDDDERTGFQNLVACVELNSREASVMDQGAHGAHHMSKANKLQVRAQLSNPGQRNGEQLRGKAAVALPGKRESEHQRREAFARKTYRFFDGDVISRADLLRLLAPTPASGGSRDLEELTFAEFGELLRWFGQFHSEERLLPKYSYASPGALYATQMYLETSGIAGLGAGVHYYHPVEHSLVRIGSSPGLPGAELAVHFVGKRQAIEPVYKNNIQEVLEFETGHMVGVFEEVLPEHGLTIRPWGHETSIKDRLEVAAEDHYVGTFEIGPHDGLPRHDSTELYLQAHPNRVADLPAGLHRHVDGELERISDEVVEPKHVIAINQQVHERAAFGIAAVSRERDAWLEYVSLGAKLHHLQRNGLQIGLMSSGYSSKTGHPLASARRLDAILDSCGIETGASYFFLGGRVSEEQIRAQDMHEDSVHMRGPAEIIKDDLARLLPDYMLPNRVLLLDQLPLTANGKVDTTALAASDEVRSAGSATPHVAPSTDTEQRLARVWGRALKYDDVSAEDEFFSTGGNSLIAVTLVNQLNREFGTRLPLQALFEHPTLTDLATRIDDDASQVSSRLVKLADGGAGAPVHCWPGLGGYPMGLRLLAAEAGTGGPFYGVQACGINAGEEPYPTIREMAAADVAEIRRAQPEGPYTLWGYSFGARVAFESAWQLEQLGEQVAELLLICPGNPRIGEVGGSATRTASYTDPAYVTILFSVFAGTTTGPEVQRCVQETHDEDSFIAFVHRAFPSLDPSVIRRITRIVGETYEFEYSFHELDERRLDAPVTLFKASGDDYSFIETSSGFSAEPPAVIELSHDHYDVLKERGVGELASAIRDLR